MYLSTWRQLIKVDKIDLCEKFNETRSNPNVVVRSSITWRKMSTQQFLSVQSKSIRIDPKLPPLPKGDYRFIVKSADDLDSDLYHVVLSYTVVNHTEFGEFGRAFVQKKILLFVAYGFCNQVNDLKYL